MDRIFVVVHLFVFLFVFLNTIVYWDAGGESNGIDSLDVFR
jgi:hypothetical protein